MIVSRFHSWHFGFSSFAVSYIASQALGICPTGFNPNQRMHNISPPPLSDSTLFFAFAFDGLSASEASCFVSEIQCRASFPSEACALLRPSPASAAPQLFPRNSSALLIMANYGLISGCRNKCMMRMVLRIKWIMTSGSYGRRKQCFDSPPKTKRACLYRITSIPWANR